MDSGDTIIDESTETRDQEDVVLSAKVIPGAVETIKTLYEEGYMLVLVADGLAQSFKNVLQQNGVYDYFASMIYSETIKQKKPHPSMFLAAMGAAGLTHADTSRILMVGNNIKRDIKGANHLGITSILLDWSPRYAYTPNCQEEEPDYTIHEPKELITLVHELERKLQNKYGDYTYNNNGR